ncbi:hypothetical protein [Streptomyces sp. I05A-00742]|uniref:hypothetical protein n=1 Tax=Streptomyces sp. I05A-00742 TaxID=2732853 RepID=UPI001488FFCA|nr:hypothetical protein [Streptomyces sp. I05A-00742]
MSGRREQPSDLPSDSPSDSPSGPPSDLPSHLSEQALRRMLQGAVGDLKPSDDALEHLRRAVPARRTRRRQALGGAVAAVVLVSAALPALMHVADTVGVTDPDDRPANASSNHRQAEEKIDDLSHDGGPGGTGRSQGGTAARGDHRAEQPTSGSTPKESVAPSEPRDTGGRATPGPGVTLSAAAPTCDRAQLGKGSGQVGAADAAGRVYGAFRVVNVSRAICAVTGPGAVVARAGNGAQKSRISVVDHMVGDPAAGLPDPGRSPRAVVLRPGQAYEVKFAWVPAADGGKAGCTKNGGGTTPAPSAGASSTTGGGSAGAAPVTPQTPSPPAAVAPTPGTPASPAPASGVTLTNTPMAGEPAAAEARIPDACAGTVYHTGALPAAAPPG